MKGLARGRAFIIIIEKDIHTQVVKGSGFGRTPLIIECMYRK